MKNYLFLLTIFFTLFIACKNDKKMKIDYPKPKKVDSASVFFGTKVADPYRWMENESDSDLVAWIDAQNNITNKFLKNISFKQKIYNRLEEIYNYEKKSSLYKKGGKYFFYKNDGLQNQSVLYVQKDIKSEPRVLLDPNKLSDDGTVALSSTGVSKNGKYLAYAIARSGSDWNEINVMDIETGQKLSDNIKWVKFSGIAWYKNGFFYSRYEQPKKGEELSSANKNHKVYYHKIGTSQNNDSLIYKDPKVPSHGFNAEVSDNEKYLIISEWEGTSGNILYFKDLTKPNSDFVKINDNFDYDYSFIDNLNGKLIVLTNYKAPNYKIIAINPEKPTQKNWQDFIPESENVLQNINISKENIVVEYIEDVKSILKIYDFNGKYIKNIELPGIGSVSSISANREDNFIFYKFSSYINPGTIYKYSFKSDKNEIFYKTQFKGLNLDNYAINQVFYKSKDGTEIPMFIVHKKDIELNGNNPAWLYGYGGFSISLSPSFDVRRLLWLEQGGVFAVANIRGGGEYGEKWHKQGILMNKQNVFDDFIAAAEYLIDKKYTNSDLLAIQGGSNGGLLVGAVTNQRPELFKVALPAVGVMDMLRYHKFTIGKAWASDYGLPTESKKMFEYIYSYSPLHNIDENKNYPAVMVTTADHDDRVVPAHSFKYIATLQEKNSDNKNPLLIRIETKAGHGAGKPTEKLLEEWADLYAFTFYNMDIEPKFNK